MTARRPVPLEVLAGRSPAPDVIGVLVAADPDGPTPLTDPPVPLDSAVMKQRGFSAKVGAALTLVGRGDEPSEILIGCGPRPRIDAEILRRAGAAFVRGAGQSGTAELRLGEAAPDALGEGTTGLRRAAQALAEGVALGAYRFDRHRSKPGPATVSSVSIACAGDDDARQAVEDGVARGVAFGRATSFARDLANEPPSELTPARLAALVVDSVGSRAGVHVEVWDEEQITDERLGALLGVARGLVQPPRLLLATYTPLERTGQFGAAPHVALVGKGITFDSGGLSLKSASGMVTMKTDMSGAAAALAAVSECGDLGVRAKVTAITPLTENMPGGDALKPGDVLTARDGQTIEVLNTDAEGRLVLADALCLARELEPDAIIDLATLTGAVRVALGSGVAGVFANDDPLFGRLRAAAAASGERCWRLPLVDEYREHIESQVADMQNIGRPEQAGSVVAALLLERFVGDTPWAHLDIAGVARSDDDAGYRVKGATGWGARLLLELLTAWA